MPVEVSRAREGSVVVAHCFGRLSEADVCEAIDFAFGSRQIEPSMDRIVIFDPDTELHELDIEALRHIQQSLIHHELRAVGQACFRSVLVSSSAIQRSLLELYKAIWDELDLPAVSFSVVASEEEAWRILGPMPNVLQRVAD